MSQPEATAAQRRPASGSPVAVVVTCYEQRQFLAEAIASAVREQPAEVVVVDDGCSQPLDDVVNRFAHVRLHRQDNQGAAAARNTGLALTTAPYVVFLDADDRLLPGNLQAGVDSLDRNPEAAFTSGRSLLICGDGSPLGRHVTVEPRSTDLYRSMLRRPYVCPPACAMFRRDALVAAGGWREGDELYGVEDWEIYLRLSYSRPVVSRQDVVAEYRVHPGQSSNRTAAVRQSIETLLGDERAFTAGRWQLERARVSGLRHWRIRTSYDLARWRRGQRPPRPTTLPVTRTDANYLFWLAARTLQRVPESRPWRRLRQAMTGPPPPEIVGVPHAGERRLAPARRPG